MRCLNCEQRIVTFAEFGDSLVRALRFTCPHCGQRVRPSWGTIVGILTIPVLGHALYFVAEVLSRRLGVTDFSLQIFVFAALATPVLIPLAYFVWKAGWFVPRK